jgi:hypothetical protein
MQEIRYLDKLVDELARGKAMGRSFARGDPAPQVLVDPGASPGAPAF